MKNIKLNNAQEAIEQAIEGGWNDDNYAFGVEDKSKEKIVVGAWCYTDNVFLDPLFWQALGKVRGWKAPIGLEGDDQCRHIARIWFDTHVWHPENETNFWQSLP